MGMFTSSTKKIIVVPGGAPSSVLRLRSNLFSNWSTTLLVLVWALKLADAVAKSSPAS